jgi:hypothetical protein
LIALRVTYPLGENKGFIPIVPGGCPAAHEETGSHFLLKNALFFWLSTTAEIIEK